MARLDKAQAMFSSPAARYERAAKRSGKSATSEKRRRGLSRKF
jgi:hypothetical protein